jgi:uncharacterized protein (TIGR02996 family)
LKTICARPDDDAPRAVYADWLLERGDPLREFITLQLARVAGRAPKGCAKRKKALITSMEGMVAQILPMVTRRQTRWLRSLTLHASDGIESGAEVLSGAWAELEQLEFVDYKRVWTRGSAGALDFVRQRNSLALERSHQRALEVGLRVEAVELRRLEQAVEDGGDLGSPDRV